MLEFNLTNEKLILFSAKAAQVKSLIDHFITEIKKVHTHTHSYTDTHTHHTLSSPVQDSEYTHTPHTQTLHTPHTLSPAGL